MAHKDNSTQLTLAPAPVSFLSENIDLKRLLKEVSKHSKPAVEVIVSLLTSFDEKVRMQAAKVLLDYQVQVAKEISVDQMQRLIAEIKINRGGVKRLVDGEEEKFMPSVDFSNVQSVE